MRLDASARTVHVQGGATWADVDEVTAPLGLATTGGVVSETGVAGLALNGGVSHQRRRDGMTIDNLVSAEVVLSDGGRARASADEHPDLYWALRGGAAISAWSPRSSSACTSSDPRCSRARGVPPRGRRARAHGVA